MHLIIFLGLTIPIGAVHLNAVKTGSTRLMANVKTGSDTLSNISHTAQRGQPRYGFGCYPARSQRKPSTTWEWTPGTQDPAKFLFSIPNRAGMNAQLIKVYEDIAAAKSLGRTLVLPMLEDHKVLREHSRGYHSFTDYFDKSYMDGLNILSITPQDLNGTQCGGLVYFNGTIENTKIARLYKKRFGVTFVEMTNPASEVSSRSCIAQYRPKTGFPSYSFYATYGQGYSLKWGQTNEFAKAWYTVTPSEGVMFETDMVLKEMPTFYNAIHLRRGDFRLLCEKRFMKGLIQQFGDNSCYQNDTHIRDMMLSFADNTLPIYVATDDIGAAVRLLGKNLAVAPWHEKDSRVGFAYGDINQRIIFYHYHNITQSDLTGIIDQVISANAVQFMANRFSSFSTAVNNMRLECNPSATLDFWQ